ncbi:YsnF/AvaK domain-containing protein [Nostoc muscorum FACHB-395]|nr:YsnF/AvaK domain-containing protein [Desmonostoc muscorum FACHB-395]
MTRIIKLYQERLIANKTRTKTGEVAIGKYIETETGRVSVPIEKERVVIERVTPADAGKSVAPGSVSFSEGEVARIEVHEETADIHKETFVREEVRITKVVDHENVETQETLRREELDIDT